jgi:uncharacterized protein YhaN
MKKLVLAMVFILLMALFIAFNYLLLDRENKIKELRDLEAANLNNSANMSMQTREIKNLEDENDSLQQKVSQLESERDQLAKSKSELTAERDRLNSLLAGKNDMLNALKQISDPKELGQPAKKWAEALNAGDYSTAYEMEYVSLVSYGNPPSTFEYSENLKNNIKSISLKSIKLDTTRGVDSGEIILNVELEVKLLEKATTQNFVDGLNEKFVKIGYDTAKKEFVILQIF